MAGNIDITLVVIAGILALIALGALAALVYVVRLMILRVFPPDAGKPSPPPQAKCLTPIMIGLGTSIAGGLLVSWITGVV